MAVSLDSTEPTTNWNMILETVILEHTKRRTRQVWQHHLMQIRMLEPSAPNSDTPWSAHPRVWSDSNKLVMSLGHIAVSGLCSLLAYSPKKFPEGAWRAVPSDYVNTSNLETRHLYSS